VLSQKVHFGLQFRTLVPNEFFSGAPTNIQTDSLSGSVSSKIGFGFGMIIRHDFTDKWSIETGINQLRRNFLVAADNDFNEEDEEMRVGFINYEIPVRGLYYLQISREWYMNVMSGISFNMNPSDVYKNSPENNYQTYIDKRGWMTLSLLANVGLEYRTPESGNIYLGFSLHRPFRDVMRADLSYVSGGIEKRRASSYLPGNFLSIDLRYFFPGEEREVREKKEK
jgi:hypothetical protein